MRLECLLIIRAQHNSQNNHLIYSNTALISPVITSSQPMIDTILTPITEALYAGPLSRSIEMSVSNGLVVIALNRKMLLK